MLVAKLKSRIAVRHRIRVRRICKFGCRVGKNRSCLIENTKLGADDDYLDYGECDPVGGEVEEMWDVGRTVHTRWVAKERNAKRKKKIGNHSQVGEK